MAGRSTMPLERSFVVLVTVMGAMLLLMAASMTSSSERSGLVRRYALASRAFLRQNLGDSSEAGQRATHGPGILSPDAFRHINITRLLVVHPTTGTPVTDPPWMKQRPRPLMPLRPSAPHPYLRGYVLESGDVCSNVSVDVLIVVHSALENFHRRRLLRETWAGRDGVLGVTVRTVFVLGRNDSSPQNQVLVNTEQANHGDIVQGDFQDTFGNLTLKALTALRWVNEHCLHARVVLKADDDIFLNVFLLLERFLPRLAGRRRTVMCTAKKENTSVIVRTAPSKWQVPEHVLPGRTHWPAFCSGFVVLLTPDTVPLLYEASFSTGPVPVDDAFVYGVLPLAFKEPLTYLDMSADLMVDDGRLLRLYRETRGTSPKLAGTTLSHVAFVQLWQLTLQGLSPWARSRAAVLQRTVNVSALNF